MLKLSDYTIDHAGIDWPDLLASWAWLLPRELTVWLMNRFGDLFLVFNDGSVQMLDVGRGSWSEWPTARRTSHAGSMKATTLTSG
jgi:hypothetical protein